LVNLIFNIRACGAGQAPSVELLLALGANPNVIDFSTTECSTPFDYAISVGSYECAQIVHKFGGLEAKRLIKKSTAIIAKFWRQTQHKRAIVPQPAKPMKEYRRGSIMRRLSHTPLPEPIIEVMHDSNEFLQIEPENHAKAPETLKLVPNTTNVLNRRHSTVGIVSRRKSSFLDLNMLNEDLITDQISAAIKIQKAWKRYCLKLETKFLIQVMGSEEASQMVERLMEKERQKEIKRYLHERARRKSHRDFPSKSTVDSRRSSFSFVRADTNGIIPLESSDESSKIGTNTTRRRNSFMTDFGRKDSKNPPKNPSFINRSESGSLSNASSVQTPNTLGNFLGPTPKPLSRAPTVFKMTISEDELAYLAMERERHQQEDG
jgi:hypothetical protein